MTTNRKRKSNPKLNGRARVFMEISHLRIYEKDLAEFIRTKAKVEDRSIHKQVRAFVRDAMKREADAGAAA